MENLFNWIKESNRYKHLIGGFIVGLFSLGVWAALYSGIVAAVCLEYKDKAWGGKWEWADFCLTVSGALIASVTHYMIIT